MQRLCAARPLAGARRFAALAATARVNPPAALARRAVGKARSRTHIVTRVAYDEDVETETMEMETHFLYKKMAAHVALGPNNTYYIASLKPGPQEQSWSAGLPEGLWATLRARKKSSRSDRVEFLSFGGWEAGGEEEVWFVRYKDGSTEWGRDTDSGFDETLEEFENVEAAYFGPDGAWLVLHEGGTTYYNLPGGMAQAVDQAGEFGGLRNAAMGPNGEWVVNAEEFVWWSDNVHPSLARVLESEELGGLRLIRLGEEGTFYAEFRDKTVWRGTQEFTDDLMAYRNL